MNTHVKTFTASIETDSGKDRHLSCIDAMLLAADILELAPHIPDAIAFYSGNAEVCEAISQKLLDRYGAEVDDNGVHPNGFGDTFPDRLHDDLQDLVRDSQAAKDYADDMDTYGYALDQHHADERAMLMMGVA